MLINPISTYAPAYIRCRIQDLFTRSATGDVSPQRHAASRRRPPPSRHSLISPVCLLVSSIARHLQISTPFMGKCCYFRNIVDVEAIYKSSICCRGCETIREIRRHFNVLKVRVMRRFFFAVQIGNVFVVFPALHSHLALNYITKTQ